MTCTQCNESIDFLGEDISVRVIFKDGHHEDHCQHNPFNENDPEIEAILGSADCYSKYIRARRVGN
jgi:hypothetical protein